MRSRVPAHKVRTWKRGQERIKRFWSEIAAHNEDSKALTECTVCGQASRWYQLDASGRCVRCQP